MPPGTTTPATSAEIVFRVSHRHCLDSRKSPRKHLISVLCFTKSIPVTCPLDLSRSAGRPACLSPFLTEKLSLKCKRPRTETRGFCTSVAFCCLLGGKWPQIPLWGHRVPDSRSGVPLPSTEMRCWGIHAPPPPVCGPACWMEHVRPPRSLT